ncbi:PREDICTED: protein ENHANCED DISEASE RESISTANCE 2-like [Camelina sativa]|uniref:Protein ENHANCED DISEASE RESISTANCE 2-like n=1 Tax=Camelina sativa TaxID=90675 RepID=A0ABM0VKT5_CAMSA|nr:PREDICTED: protein ENHANCED DISEASE RESISTANCE 2-like [Camelina sativa]XP_010457720.1 PREDICTED: protein ENHANCED DISEASE RESISTANCE 2-like [Camelina sativa]
MAGSVGEETEPEWIKRVKSEGAVPCLKPDNCNNGWTTPSPDTFMVRGPKYFSDKAKIPADDFLLKPLGFDWIKGPNKLSEILSYPSSRIRKAIDEETQTNGTTKPFVWAFNLQLPHKDNYSAVAYFVTTEPILEGSLMDRFLKGDDGFKKSRLKLIANIVKGPWIVRKAVGEQAICVIGRALSCKYVTGDNFVEVDVDIGSSMVASAIVHLAFGYITTLTVDLAFLIESQTDSELPEQLLGAVRFSELQTESGRSIELSGNEDQTTLERSSWWKSIGNGFSNLLNQDTANMNNTTCHGDIHKDVHV